MNVKKAYDNQFTRESTWKEMVSYMMTLPDPDRILREKGHDLSVYRALSFDSHVDSCITSREAGLLSSEWDIVTDSSKRADKVAKDFIRDCLSGLDIEQIFRDCLEAVYYGFSVLEKTFKTDGSHIVWNSIIGKPSEWFNFDGENRLRFLAKGSSMTGELVDMERVELVQYRASYRNPYGERKMARIFWPVTFKKSGIKFWMNFLEKYGGNLLYAKTQSNDEDYQNKLLNMLGEMIETGVAVISTDDELIPITADKAGTSASFEGLAAMCNSEISKAILGQTLTTEQGKVGSQALGKVHFDVRKDIVESDKNLVKQVVNRMIRQLVDFNFNVSAYPTLRFFEEEDIKSERAERDTKLVGMGLEFKKEYFAENYNLKEEHFELKAIQMELPFESSPQTEDVKKNDDANAVIPFAESEFVVKQAELDALVDKSYPQFTAAFKGVLNGVETALKDATDYETAIQLIVGTDKSTDSDYLARALLTAQVIGRKQVGSELSHKSKRFKRFSDKEVVLRFAGSDAVMDYPEARRFLSSKLAMTDTEFKALTENLKDYAFTVSGITQTDVIAGVLDKLTKALDSGITYDQFKKQFDPSILVKNSLSTVYRQNLQTAYMVGRFEEMKAVSDELPYWMYVSVLDGRTRPVHRAMNGIIRRFDDPFWDKWYPPNGFLCRCSVTAHDASDLKRLGLSAGEGIPSLEDINPEAVQIGNISGSVNPKSPLQPDEGFGHNTANYKVWINDKVNEAYKKNPKIKRLKLNEKSYAEYGLDKFERMGYSENIELSEKATKSEALNNLKEVLNSKDYVANYRNTPVFVNPKMLLEHIEKDPNRFKYIGVMDRILKAPDEVWTTLQMDTKDKRLILARNYMKMVNETPVILVTHSIGGIDIAWTIYPNRKSIDGERMGILNKIKKDK